MPTISQKLFPFVLMQTNEIIFQSQKSKRRNLFLRKMFQQREQNTTFFSLKWFHAKLIIIIVHGKKANTTNNKRKLFILNSFRKCSPVLKQSRKQSITFGTPERPEWCLIALLKKSEICCNLIFSGFSPGFPVFWLKFGSFKQFWNLRPFAVL